MCKNAKRIALAVALAVVGVSTPARAEPVGMSLPSQRLETSFSPLVRTKALLRLTSQVKAGDPAAREILQRATLLDRVDTVRVAALLVLASAPSCDGLESTIASAAQDPSSAVRNLAGRVAARLRCSPPGATLAAVR